MRCTVAVLAVVASLGPQVARADDAPILTLDALEVLGAPAAGAFTLQHEFDADVVEAAVELWPEALSPCTSPRPVDARQSYRLELSLTRREKNVGTARLPHLQVGQRFCVVLRMTRHLSPPQSAIRASVESGLAALAGAPETWTEARVVDRILDLAVGSFCTLGPAPAAEPPCLPIDRARLGPIVAGSRTRLRALRFDRTEAETRSSSASAALPGLQQALRAALGTRRENLGPNDRDLTLIDAALTRLRPTVTASRAVEALRRWRAALVEEQEAVDEAKRAQRAWKAARSGVIAETAAALTAALATQIARAEASEPRRLTVKSGDFKNYFSPELGVAAGILPVRGHADAWIAPYTAINVYFTPVDRELAFDQLVDPMRQRVSLTLGFSLATPVKVGERKLGPVFAGGYGVFGVGFRVLPQARVAALLFVMKAEPETALSTGSTLVFAPALAVSADLDVVTFLSAQLSK